MFAGNLHAATLAVLCLLAGLVMADATIAKKALGWKRPSRRCPACGRVSRGRCACRN
jgi:hypothetical protein